MLFLFLACTPPDRALYPVPLPDGFVHHGIDVSHYQGDIDWERVSSHTDFAFLKATEGKTWSDRRFAANWTEAHEQGLPTGAYHYFSACHSGAVQAEWFIQQVPRVEGALPPVLDVEEDRRCNKPGRIQRAEVEAWLARVEDHFGVRPLVYATDRTHRQLGDVSAMRWVAAYSRPPRTAGWVAWQYTDRGSLPGIRGPVDRNVLSPDGYAELLGMPHEDGAQ